jgi:ATP-dependent DNA helicase RecG
MKITNLNENEVKKICKKQENHFFDKKAKEIKGKKIQKIAVAFANADGGDFIIGIKDDKEENNPLLRWSGFNTIEDYNYVFQNISEINPSIPYTQKFLYYEEIQEYALLITVEKSSSVHHTSDNTVYIRRSAQSLPLKEPQKIAELAFAKGETSYEDVILNQAYPEDIFESKQFIKFLKSYSPKTDAIDFTVNQNLVDRQNFSPKVSGILLFNDNPSSVLPRKCGIKITRYETDEEIPERHHLKEQITVEGALYDQIHEASEKITAFMSNINIWTTKGLDKVSYPPEAIWEILVNAVIHRDYSISDDIQILIFNNRIEIRSPGKLPGYVTTDNILEARYSRNPKIVRNLNRYNPPPNRDMGEGLNTAFQKMKEWKLKNPKIIQENNYVKVIIPHTPLATPEEAVLEFLKNNHEIKNSQARMITGIKSENKMKNVFNRLKSEGLIEKVPGTRTASTRWRLIEK